MPLYRNAGNIVFFVHIPKTGGASLEAALRKTGAAEALRFKSKNAFSKSTMQHIHADIWKQIVGHRFYDWAFTVVRNPYDRFASEYKMKVIDSGGDDPIDEWAQTNFARFREYPYTRDNHIRPQHEFVSRNVEIFRFEDGLDRPLAAAAKCLDVPMPALPHRKRGSLNRVRATRRTVELIGGFYASDFSRFQYDPDDHESAFELI